MTDPLADLRERFRARLVEDLARLRTLMADEAGSELRILAHNLAGAAGTFGFPAVSERAVAIDDRYATGQTPTREELAALEAALITVIEEG